jgi:hypothetical protein
MREASLADESNQEVATTQRLPKERTAPRPGMNAVQVDAWYDGLGGDGDKRKGIGAHLAIYSSGLLNVLLIYAVIHLMIALPSLDRQRQTAGKRGADSFMRAGESSFSQEEARKARRDGKR